MKALEFIPMEPAFQQEIRERYTKPFRKNVRGLVGSLLLVYCLIILGQLFFSEKETGINFVPVIAVTAGFLLVFWMAFPKFKKANYHYLNDAEFGMIVREQMQITKVFDTPAGIPIYWLDSDAIKTFTPDPFRHFRMGDVVTIYYLKFSKEYLAYEV